MTGRRATVLVVAVGLTMSLAGCQWMSTGWDASGSASNTVETHLGVANVASLHEDWRADPGTGQDAGITPVATGNELIAVAKTNATTAELDAYAADGSTGCSGVPRTCQPAWHTSGTSFSQPLAADGVVYVDNGGVLAAYDATGVQNCSGSPRVCLPLWTGTGAGGHPILEDGQIYVAGTGEIDAYTTDTSACTGSPMVCHPVATYRTTDVCGVPASCPVAALVADHDRLYASLVFTSTISIPFMGHTIIEPTVTQDLAAYDIGGSSVPVWLQQYNYEIDQPPSVSGLMDVGGQIYATGSNGLLLGSWTPFVGMQAFTPTGATVWQSRLVLGPSAAAPDAVFAAGGPACVRGLRAGHGMWRHRQLGPTHPPALLRRRHPRRDHRPRPGQRRGSTPAATTRSWPSTPPATRVARPARWCASPSPPSP